VLTVLKPKRSDREHRHEHRGDERNAHAGDEDAGEDCQNHRTARARSTDHAAAAASGRPMRWSNFAKFSGPLIHFAAP